MSRKCIGFILIREYPRSKKLHSFEPYTTGEFLRYPEIWKPIYNETGPTKVVYPIKVIQVEPIMIKENGKVPSDITDEDKNTFKLGFAWGVILSFLVIAIFYIYLK